MDCCASGGWFGPLSLTVRASPMTIWHIIIFAFLAAEVALEVRDISKMGLREWFRESCRKSWFQHFAADFPSACA